MKDKNSIVNEALSIIDAALTILSKYPDTTQSGYSVSVAGSLNPFAFLLELFKTTAGYDYVLNVLSIFIETALPALELNVKTVLISNLKNLLSTCTIQPLITEQLLKEGIAFSLPQIDITDMLKYSPLSLNGKYYYFGCKGCTCPDDVRDTAYLNGNDNTVGGGNNGKFYESFGDAFFGTRDMNALLWFMKTRSSHREVWGRKSPLAERQGDEKQQKKDGILTLEFVERPTSLTDAEGGALYLQVPDYDILHVFIGNTLPIDYFDKVSAYNSQSDRLKSCRNTVEIIKNDLNKLIEDYKESVKELQDNLTTAANPDYPKDALKSDIKNTKIGIKQLRSVLKKNSSVENVWKLAIGNTPTGDAQINEALNSANDWVTSCGDWMVAGSGADKDVPEFDELDTPYIEDIEELLTEIENRIFISKSKKIYECSYRKVDKNYYHNKTLFEFNFDYVMSLKLFDEKVVAAQLIDQLVKCLQVDYSLSFKQQYIREQVKSIVLNISTTDDVEVDDCFFTFSNDKYNEMLKKVDLYRAGVLNGDNVAAAGQTINNEKIMGMLNGIDPSAEGVENEDLIQGVRNVQYSEVLAGVYEEVSGFSTDGKVRIDFIENLLNNLAYVIVSSVISPKVYLLILVNLKLIGENSNMGVDAFINEFKNLLTALIRQIRDYIIQYLVDELQKLLGEIAAQVAVKVGLEQAVYYKKLIKKILDCLKRTRREGYGFTVEDAIVDIAEQELENGESLDNNCSAFK